MRDLEKRLVELEKRIKASADSAIWIDGSNATLRVDITGKRGKEITFPSVYAARLWLEDQIDKHPAGGVIGYSVDNVCDLAEDADELRAAVKKIIPGQIIVPQTTGRVIGGQVQPLIFDADENFTAILAMRGIKPGMTADLRLWCLAALIKQYFGDRQFAERWKADQLTADDNCMFLACLVVYAWQRPGSAEEIRAGFSRLFYQVSELPVPEPGQDPSIPA